MHRLARPLPILAAALAAAGPAAGGLPELLYVSEGNNLRRIDLDTLDSGAVLEEMVFRNADQDPERGRDINGMVCALPGDSALLLAAEDTAQPHPPAGWGVLTGDGVQVGKLTATVLSDTPDPYGCAVDAQGRVFATETGRKFFGGATGQLLLWFPPFDAFPGPPGAYPSTDATSANYCKLATDLGTALGVAVDPDGRVYVAAASGREVVRFSPPFPSGPDAAGGCTGRDSLGSPMAEGVTRERFLGAQWRHGLITYSGLALAPNGNLYVSSVATGRIAEFDRNGGFVRMILDPAASIQENELAGVSMFPNPTDGLVQVVVDQPQAVDITVMNTLGEVVKSGRFVGRTTIDLGAFAPGVYSIRLTDGTSTTTQLVARH